MKNIDKNFEVAIGLEIHIQLLTKTKMFSSEKNCHSEIPNSQISETSLAYPGTLPVPNQKAIEFAIRLGIACNSQISKQVEFVRKNYFYYDLPKAYQITQKDCPICKGGNIKINFLKATEKQINITSIQLEEDSAKTIYDKDSNIALIDMNRAGIPLLEIVTAPEIKNSEEVVLFVSEIRKLVRYLEISDGNLESGSLRCDANISVREKNTEIAETHSEIKNLNSFSNLRNSINAEIDRQAKILSNGKKPESITLAFDKVKNKVFPVRNKLSAKDYRFISEPDILPLLLEKKYIDEISKKMPHLPNYYLSKFIKLCNLSYYDANLLSENKEIAIYFSEIILHTKNYKIAANWLLVQIKTYLKENKITIKKFSISALNIASLVNLIADEKISHTSAQKKVFPEMLANPCKSPAEIIKNQNLESDISEADLNCLANEIIRKHPDKVIKYKNGKTKIINVLINEIMKETNGEVQPKLIKKLLQDKLEIK